VRNDFVVKCRKHHVLDCEAMLLEEALSYG